MLFSRWSIAVSGNPPDWFVNPLSGQRFPDAGRPWWEIPDFDPAVGDIKVVWELSRMDWVVAFAQSGCLGDVESINRLNVWLSSWCRGNPPYRGPNWKCGQEASFRVIHLATAAMMLGQTSLALPGLRALIAIHMRRIEPTVGYAMAQDNNHGTSEAAALYIGGSWLTLLGDVCGGRWYETGKRLLEERVGRLIGPQGSFSQYSLNYHRLVVDTLSIVEIWRRALSLPALSAHWQSRALAATEWLRHMVNDENGDGPNVGANDGARLLQLTDSDYRDYRPSVALAIALFGKMRAYSDDGPWSGALAWLGLAVPDLPAPAKRDYEADDGGFAVLRRGRAMVMMRYPRFRFRPSQSDALHVDLWIGRDNLLRDAGTYSYNCDSQWLDYFAGTRSHNTIEFDGRDQMPRLGRFLFGEWLKISRLEPISQQGNTVSFGAGYRDGWGACHFRRVHLAANQFRCEDKITGTFNQAVIRWRLLPGRWCRRHEMPSYGISGTKNKAVFADDNGHQVTITSNTPIAGCEIVEAWESRHYLEKTPLPALEITLQSSAEVTTEVIWPA